MLSVPIVPQALLFLYGIMAGLLTSSLRKQHGLPKLFMEVCVIDIIETSRLSDTVGCPVNKGHTATGIVADSHCFPILAPPPHRCFHCGRGRENLDTAAKLQRIVQPCKFN